MKTLHLFHSIDLTNGVDRSTLTLVKALVRAGHTPHALVPSRGAVCAALDEAGIPYRLAPLPCCTGPAPMAELRYFARAAQRSAEIFDWLQHEIFDLVHLNTGHLIDGAIAAARAGVPALWHLHAPFDVDYQRYARNLSPAAYAWLLGELASHVLAVSDDVRASLLPHLAGSKVSTLYNGIDVEEVDRLSRPPFATDIRSELGLRPDSRLVVGIGRISAQKDFAAFVRVAARLSHAHRDLYFTISGPKEDRLLGDALAAQIHESNLQRRVFLLGPRDDVPALLAQANAFLSTALFEGQGLAAIEAMALQRPVVAMACVGLRECITHEVDGLLCQPGDEIGCAAAIERLLTQPELAHRLGQAARQSVIERFGAAAYAEGFLHQAQRVLRTHAPSQQPVADFALGLLQVTNTAWTRLAVQPGATPNGILQRIWRKFAR